MSPVRGIRLTGLDGREDDDPEWASTLLCAVCPDMVGEDAGFRTGQAGGSLQTFPRLG